KDPFKSISFSRNSGSKGLNRLEAIMADYWTASSNETGCLSQEFRKNDIIYSSISGMSDQLSCRPD
ncbi:MAG: hypothetical protein QGG95_00315, partial [Nitrospinota bacterium]|nr:hypothetical protein [Nitrospinota bacterium]